MFTAKEGEEIFQTQPGAGWRALIHWQDRVGKPVTLEPVILWVTMRQADDDEHIVIVPLVRDYDLSCILNTLSDDDRFVLLAPGETLQPRHFDEVEGTKDRVNELVSRG